MKKFAVLLALLGACAPSSADKTDALYEGFVDPPNPARPQAWWHWMNGYIDAQEARKDLEWLRSVGVGGVQVFEVGLGPEAPLEQRVVYGTDAWRTAIEAAAASAKSLGLDFAITTSPGWSATGGPWVEPADAMKKLVWSVTPVNGRRKTRMRLQVPPSVAGPYQDIPASVVGGTYDTPGYYRDIVTLAVPVDAATATYTVFAIDEIPMGAEQLGDGKFWPASVVTADGNGEASVRLTVEKPVSIQGVTVGLPGARGFGTPEPPYVELQYSIDGVTFLKLAELPATHSMVRSASFAPVRASFFRLLLAPSKAPGFMASLDYAPGAMQLPVPGNAASYEVSEIILHTGPRIHAVEEKAGFATAADYYELATPTHLQATTRSQDIVDVTRLVDEDGVLHWNVPPGDWQILRIGFSLTGKHNGPAPREATGLEVDKLSADSVVRYLNAYLSTYSDEGGALFDGITGLLSDSIESGPQNWTENLPAEFKRRHGYDPLPWLPTITGLIIDSPEASDRFLWDFRETIASLYAKSHYGVIDNAAASRALTYYAEALEDHRPQLGNDLDMRASADVPMAAFWFFAPPKGPKATYVMDVKGAASVANVYGRPVVAVEAMTTFGHPWAVGPRELKIAADRAFVAGGNRLMLHSSVHQAVSRNHTPGQSIMPLLGHYFNRNVTWSGLAKPWIDYLARTQFLLQQGHFVADFAYFIGEEAPVTGLFGDSAPAGIPEGFDYDFVSAQGLEQLAVDDDGLKARSGTRYRFLFLGGSSRQMTLAVLNRIRALAIEGVVIAGQKPFTSPSLRDDKEEFAALVETVWALDNVIDADSPDEAIRSLELKPGWEFASSGMSISHPLAVHRRRLPDGEIYYVVNTLADRVDGTFRIEATRMDLEFWHPTTGSRRAPRISQIAGGGTDIDLELAPHESVFVVVRSRHQDRQTLKPRSSKPEKVISFASNWTVSFDPQFAEVGDLAMPEVAPLDQHGDPRVRYYSGLTTWSNTVALSASDLEAVSEASLSVAGVGDIAEVRVNGVVAGSLWTPPYQLELKPYLMPGKNRIDIEVANLWANRLIGLARESRAVDSFPDSVYEDNAPLRTAGLVGPAKLAIR